MPECGTYPVREQPQIYVWEEIFIPKQSASRDGMTKRCSVCGSTDGRTQLIPYIQEHIHNNKLKITMTRNQQGDLYLCSDVGKALCNCVYGDCQKLLFAMVDQLCDVDYSVYVMPDCDEIVKSIRDAYKDRLDGRSRRYIERQYIESVSVVEIDGREGIRLLMPIDTVMSIHNYTRALIRFATIISDVFYTYNEEVHGGITL